MGKSLLVAARADLGAPPVCPLMRPQFVHSPLPSFSTDFPISVLHISFPLLSSLIFRVLHDIQCAKLVIFSVISCDERFSALVLFKLNSVDGRGHIGRDVEEEERKRVVINKAAEDDDDDNSDSPNLIA